MHESLDIGTSVSIGAAVVAGFVGMFKWLIGREVARFDEDRSRLDAHEHRIVDLEKKAIDKEDLDRTESRIISAIGEVRQSVNSAHERIDRMTERR